MEAQQCKKCQERRMNVLASYRVYCAEVRTDVLESTTQDKTRVYKTQWELDKCTMALNFLYLDETIDHLWTPCLHLG